ncbi:hypothetical protein KR054_009117 [Drosophila jambulina]|nr:hypothetical protein KR054_009117 [Drosophila jambulina]
MVQRCSLLFIAALMMVSQVSQAHFPEYCAECEQEVWEQVPCSEVPSTPATPTTPRTTTTGTTPRPLTTVVPITTTSLPFYPTTTSNPNVPTTEPPSAYKKCYCECKLGCKEFCRKVVASNPKQPLTQISSIGEYVNGGQVEITHVHQRKYFPKYAGEGYSGAVGGPKAYKAPYPVAYERVGAEASPASIPSVASSSSPSVASIAAPNYTLEELAQLLSTAYGSKKGYPSRPQLQPAPPSPSVYYSPVYRQGPVEPILSKVLPAPKRTIKFAAAAVAASNGVSLAKIKTPYEEKVVVATPSTIYDRTTSYPIVEEVQKVYSAPQTESYPSQTEAYPNVTPIYPSPTESYPSHKESYPSHKESYPSITESYPSQTESYPSITESYQSPQPQAKTYGGLESGADKPSSTFDLAIDNYLKDFGYGNQGRGYGDY